MTRFYTKKGDDGYTSLLGEGRTPKYDRRIETVGAIDEANAAIALARTLSISPETAPHITGCSKRFISHHVRSCGHPRKCLTFSYHQR